jgi:hypothetical protein
MKNRGLKNRFNPDKLLRYWGADDKCSWCGKFGFNCFHHIISSQSWGWKKGNFNSSILNACPIHNEVCHLYNPALHKKENEKKLLMITLKHLVRKKYQFTDIDKQFFEAYKEMYKGLTNSN